MTVPVLMTQSGDVEQMWDYSIKKLGGIKRWAMAESGQLYGGGSKNARRLWFSGCIILFLACYELCKNKDSVWGYKEDLLKMTPIAGSGF